MSDTPRPNDLVTARRRALGVVVVIFSGFGLVALVRLLDLAPPAPTVVGCAVAILALLALQIVVATQPELSRRGVALLVSGQAVLTLGPLLLVGEAWVGMPGFLAGTLLLHGGPRWGRVGFGGTVLGTAAVEFTFDPSFPSVVYVAISTVLTGLVAWALTRLTHALVQLEDAHAELARSAVLEERLRFSRDLHDLLGHGLSAIVLKTEIARRVVHVEPAAAECELAEVLGVARRALSDVRGVADASRVLALPDELSSARSLLVAADVDVCVDADPGLDTLPAETATVLAIALREGVTNVVRHAAAEHCSVVVRHDGDEAVLVIENDGASAPAPTPPTRTGHGLDNLARRFHERGGTFRAEYRTGGTFHLRAVIPSEAAVRGSADERTSGPHPADDGSRDPHDDGDPPLRGPGGWGRTVLTRPTGRRSRAPGGGVPVEHG